MVLKNSAFWRGKFDMKKKGISFIVLIITILVILILSVAIILSITKNDPILSANKVINENDLKVAQEAVIAWIGERWLKDNDEDGVMGEEIGALYSGTITREESEVTMIQGKEEKKILVTLADFELAKLDEVVIEKNRVKSISKNGIKYEGNGVISGGSGEESPPIIEKVKVTFDANGGTGDRQVVEVEKNKEFILANVSFEKSGFSFANWNTQSDGTGDSYENKASMTVEDNITLYAQWKSSTSLLYAGTTEGIAITKGNNMDNVYRGNYTFPYTLYYNFMRKAEGMKRLNVMNNTSTHYTYIKTGTNTYALNEKSGTNQWIGVCFQAGGWTTRVCVGGIKLAFENEPAMTVAQAKENGYIEPLVICASSSHSASYIYSDVSSVLEGGNTSTGNYTVLYIIFKVKSQPLTKLEFYANQNFSTTYDGLEVIQMPSDWKLSSTPW